MSPPTRRCAPRTSRSALAAAVLVAALLVALAAAGCAVQPRGSDAATTSAAPLPTTLMTTPAPVADPAGPSVTVTVPALDTPSPQDVPSESAAAMPEEEQPEGVVINAAELLEDCAACRKVIATGQAGPYAAALVTMTKKRTGLVAVDPAGKIGKPLVVEHGGVVRTPTDGALPCDDGGRCVVIADRKKGAIASAYAVGEDGAWQDISGSSAFPSASAKAGVIDVDGQLGIAVQESGEGQTGWIVLTWSGARYTVRGCAPDSDAPPTAGELSLDACLS